MGTFKKQELPGNNFISLIDREGCALYCDVVGCQKYAYIAVLIGDEHPTVEPSVLCLEHAHQTATEFLEYVKEAMRGKD